MSDGIAKAQVNFHNRAREIYFSVYQNFIDKTSGLNPRTEERSFQGLKTQYAKKLRQELHFVAQDILGDYRSDRQSAEIEKLFHQFINDYVYRFLQKSEDL